MAKVKELIPLGDKLVVRRVEAQSIDGGIIVPDDSKERPQEGLVLSVGEGRINANGNRIPINVTVGESVLFGKYAGTEIKVNDIPYLVLREEEIIGKIVEREAPAVEEVGAIG